MFRDLCICGPLQRNSKANVFVASLFKVNLCNKLKIARLLDCCVRKM